MGLVALLFSIISGICFFVMSYTQSNFLVLGSALCVSLIAGFLCSLMGICKKSYPTEAIAAMLICVTTAIAFVIFFSIHVSAATNRLLPVL